MRSFASFRKAAGKETSGALPTTIILNYHRVSPDSPSDPWDMVVHPRHFKEQMEVLRNYHVVSLAKAQQGEHARAVVITFDDGYEDNLLEAAPILEDKGFPATFFIVSGEPHRAFWWDLLSESQAARYREFLLMSHQKRRRVLKGREGRSLPRRLSEKQIRELGAKESFEIGAHTVTHSLLSELSTEEAEHEILSSRRALEEIIQGPVTSLSYPHGACPKDPNVAKRCGFSRACTVIPDRVWKYSDPFRLPRFHVSNWSGEQFALRLERWME